MEYRDDNTMDYLIATGSAVAGGLLRINAEHAADVFVYAGVAALGGLTVKFLLSRIYRIWLKLNQRDK